MNDSATYKIPADIGEIGDTTYIDLQAKDVRELYLEIFGDAAKEKFFLLKKTIFADTILSTNCHRLSTICQTRHKWCDSSQSVFQNHRQHDSRLPPSPALRVVQAISEQ